ncbi:MAG: SEC-C metal-binding domain-containing protein [Gammaproteobacteria bacterium]|nr:SEC-C metal-binding domain-containing protein [Gammaproteobacteria bacterium]
MWLRCNSSGGVPEIAKKVGRNHPCPCGSGKKYKLCCMNIDKVTAGTGQTQGIAWLRMRHTEGKLGPLLDEHAMENFGPQSMIEAWDEFTLWEDEPLDLEDPWPEFETSFHSWWIYHWVPDNADVDNRYHLPEMPVAKHYLEHEAARMDGFTKRFIDEACSQPFSFFIVLNARPGMRLTIRDLLLKREFEVHERRASRTLKKGSIIFTAVVTLDGDSIMLGCAPLIIPPSYAGIFLNMREDLADDSVEGLDLLREWDHEMRELYLDIRDDLLNPRLPEMQNTDGDPLQLTKLYYELKCSPQEAKDILAPLSMGLNGDEPKTDKDGTLVSVSFPWVKAGNAKHADWNNTTLGQIVIDGSRLTVDVNSERRAKVFKREIEKRLGDLAQLKNAAISSLEQMLKEIRDDPNGPRARSYAHGKREIDALNDSPEARLLLKEMVDSHWSAWPDTPLPMLNDETPREAAKTEIGRERLEALLWDFEQRCTGQPHDPDLAKLRKQLGMD